MLISLAMLARMRRSLSMTNVARRFGRNPTLRFTPNASATLPVGIGQQREVEAVLVGEGLLLVDDVGADPDPARADLGELVRQIAEVTTFARAPRGHRRRIEEQHDGPVGEQIDEAALGARLIGQLELRRQLTSLQHGATVSNTRVTSPHNRCLHMCRVRPLLGRDASGPGRP